MRRAYLWKGMGMGRRMDGRPWRHQKRRARRLHLWRHVSCATRQRGGTCDIHPFMDALRLFMDARLLARVARARFSSCVCVFEREAGGKGVVPEQQS